MPLNGRETCIVYCRVSTAKSAQEGESLDTQERICRGFVESRNFEVLPNGRVFRETFTGRRDERPVLDEVLDFIRANPGKVDYFVFRGIDRATRGGSYSYEHIKKELARGGVKMIDTHGVIQPTRNTLEHLGFEYEWSKTSPSEIAEVVLATTANAEVTNILTRMIGREIELTQKGFKVRAPADGYLNKRIYIDNKKRVIQVPDPDRAKFYIEMFKLRAEGILPDKEIVKRVDMMGYRTKGHNRWDRAHEKIIGKTGGAPLTVKRLQAVISRPIYCGVVCEKWTRWKPVKAQYDGLVSIETFNQANRGKVFIEESRDGLNILYDYQPGKAVTSRTRHNPLFPYKNFVLCPKCRRPFTGGSPRGKSGQRFPTYSCSRKHKYCGIPKKKFDAAFESFIKRLKFNAQVFVLVEGEFANLYHMRKKELAQKSVDALRTIADLRSEQKAKGEAFVAATSPILRAQLEKQIEDIEVVIKMASGESQKIDISTENIKEFRRQGEYYLEHLSELLLNPENPRRQATLLGLVFDTLPTYEEIAFGTPKLSWIFELSSGSTTKESLLVSLRSLDWNIIESTIKQWKRAFEGINIG